MPETYKINKDKIASRIINGEVVLLNLDSGFYYSLNKTGSEIWQYLQEGKSVEEIQALLMKKYESQSGDLRKDILALIGDLLKEKIIAKRHD